MAKPTATYRIPLVMAGVLIWEAIFWTLAGAYLLLMGYFRNPGMGTHFAFKNESALAYLWVLLPCIAGFYWLMRWKNKRFSTLGNQKIQGVILSPVSSFNTFMRFFFFRNAIVFLILAMAQPAFGSKKVSGTLESLELVLAIDISSSMNVKDIDKETSRLEIAKRAMVQLINNLHGEKLGIVIFAGGAYVQLPLTMDYDAAKMYIREIETAMISNQGTNIAAALEVSQMMFSKSNTSKAVILITDGENHEGGIDTFLAGFKKDGIELSVLALGTTNGGLIPNDPERPAAGYKTNSQGSPIVSRLNPQMAEELAAKSHGSYFVSSNAYPDLTILLKQLKQMKRTKVENLEFDVRENHYQIPLVFGILSWILFVFWSGNSVNIFENRLKIN